MMRRAITSRIRRFKRDESGATLVEFGISFTLFLVIFFALIDFGRMAFNYVVADKAVQMAARLAAVRPPACGGVPLTHARHPATPTPAPAFGSLCRNGAAICAQVSTTCTGSTANPTVNEIWGIVSGRMPFGTTPANLSFTYASDPTLGFLGGPYTPVVTVEMTGANFQFATGLGGLLSLVTGGPSATGGTIPFPPMSASLPGEDLAQGNAG